MRPASVVASVPTSARSDTTAAWRSDSICACGLRGDAGRLSSCLFLQIRQDLGAFGTGFLADAVGFGAGVGELLLVLFECCGSLCLGLFGLGNAAFNGLGALCEGLLEHRDNELDHDEHEDSKADEDDNHFPDVGNQRVGLALGGG